MFRSYGKTLIKLSLFPQLNFLSNDIVENKTKTEQNTLKETNESGWERLKIIFTVDEFNEISPELNSILNVGFLSTVVGAIYGGIMDSKEAYINFMKNNQATAFKTHLEAKRKLQDAVTLNFAKGAVKWGWRLSIFCTTFVFVSTCVSTYRNQNGVIEYVIGGASSGFLYKFNMGPRGWIVGSGLGAGLGLVCGTTTYGLLSLTGMSMDQMRYWQNYLGKTRSEAFNKAVREEIETEELGVLKLHNDVIGDAGKSLDNLEKN